MIDLVPRLAEPLLEELAAGLRAVIVNGPRQSGKTTLLRQVHEARGGAYVTLDEKRALTAAIEDPLSFLAAYPRPMMIDEVQRGGDDLVRAIKMTVDESRVRGQFILSGSSRFLTIPVLSESLAGRAGFLDLWPLAMCERTGTAPGFLEAVVEDPAALIGATSAWTRAEYLDLMVHGGYPEALTMVSERMLSNWYAGYLSTVITRDIADFAEVHQVRGLTRLLALVAARSGSPAVLADLARDSELARDTVRNYLGYLNMVFLTTELDAWSTNLNTRAAKSPRLFISDSGLAAHLLNLSAHKLRLPGNPALGGLLETFALAELVKLKAMTLSRTELYHYRDSNTREIDIVLEAADGRVVGIELKATVSPGRGAAKHLTWLRERLGDRFSAGIVLYLGPDSLSFGDRIMALPLSALWGHGRVTSQGSPAR